MLRCCATILAYRTHQCQANPSRFDKSGIGSKVVWSLDSQLGSEEARSGHALRKVRNETSFEAVTISLPSACQAPRYRPIMGYEGQRVTSDQWLGCLLTGANGPYPPRPCAPVPAGFPISRIVCYVDMRGCRSTLGPPRLNSVASSPVNWGASAPESAFSFHNCYSINVVTAAWAPGGQPPAHRVARPPETARYHLAGFARHSPTYAPEAKTRNPRFPLAWNPGHLPSSPGRGILSRQWLLQRV